MYIKYKNEFTFCRRFGKARHDELSCLAPVYQCCLVRFSTLNKLIDFHKGPVRLSDALRQSLADDVAQPVLLEAHYQALDRRLNKTLEVIYNCLLQNESKGPHSVIKKDIY